MEEDPLRDPQCMAVHPPVGTKRRRLTNAAHIALFKIDNEEIGRVEEQIRNKTYDFGEPNVGRTCIVRNGNGADASFNFSAVTGQLTTMQTPVEEHTNRSLLAYIYAHQNADTHTNVFSNDMLCGQCYAVSSALPLFPAAHIVVETQSTESMFPAGKGAIFHQNTVCTDSSGELGSKVGSGRKDRGTVLDVINKIRHMNNAVVDARSGQRCIVVGPGTTTTTKNWVIAFSPGFIIDQSKIALAKAADGDFTDYRPAKFGAVVWKKKDPIEIDGVMIQLPTLLIFDTRVIVPGNRDFYSVHRILPWIVADLKNYVGKHLSDDPKVRHARRQRIHAKHLRKIAALIEMDPEQLIDIAFEQHDAALIYTAPAAGELVW